MNSFENLDLHGLIILMVVKPLKILLFFLVVYFVLFGISIFFPQDGIVINEDMTLNFPSPADILTPEKDKYADISRIISQSTVTNDSLRSSTSPVKEPQIDTIRANIGKLKQNIHAFDFPDNHGTPLNHFFAKLLLLETRNTGFTRIMHYGDSQIEGDRITSFLRNKLQREFGGRGPGLLPALQPYGQFSQIHENSGNWQRFTVFGRRDTGIYHKRYGALASFSRYCNIQDNVNPSWLLFRPSPLSYNTAKTYNRCKLFFGYNTDPLALEVQLNEKTVAAEIYEPLNNYRFLDWNVPGHPSKIAFKFQTDGCVEVYGVSLESKTGIMVDNIAMRGSSGLIFTRIDRSLLADMYRELEVGLFILQFGGNAVPFMGDQPITYGDWFKAQLQALKKRAPGVPIIVIGVADMSVKEKDYYITYPNLERVRDAMKEATLETGCAYWDMYEAMGGKNSMPSWVFAEPPLASTDFVHFNHLGAKVIGEMFYNSLMNEYRKYKEESSTN